MSVFRWHRSPGIRHSPGRMMAGSTIALIPALAVFGFVQRYMVGGLVSGAVKG